MKLNFSRTNRPTVRFRRQAQLDTATIACRRRDTLTRTFHSRSATVSRRDEEEAVDSGVAQICNLLYRRFAIGSVFPKFLRVLRCARPAEYNSAIQQIINLRYGCEISGLKGGHQTGPQQFGVHPLGCSSWPVAVQRGARQAAFTMIEIALCLAIIGFALVAIIGVLPMGMQVQKDNRLETIINQDSTYLIEAIRHGARGMDDLTNYVDAITNTATVYDANGKPSSSITYGYTYNNSTVNGAAATPPLPINNGQRIIGLLSTPKYQYFNNGFRSNHVVAYMRAISGSAVEKATNQAARDFSFAYRVTSEIIPYASYDRNETNYTLRILTDEERLSRSNFWRYARNQQENLYEMRLLLRWPLLPNGSVGNGRQVYRTTVSSSLVRSNVLGNALYYFEPRSYVRVP